MELLFVSTNQPEWMQDNTILYNSDRKVVFMKVVPYLVNYNISKFEIHRSSTTSEIKVWWVTVHQFSVNPSDLLWASKLHFFLFISTYFLHRSCSSPCQLQHIQIWDPSEQYNSRNPGMMSDCLSFVCQPVRFVVSFETLFSLAQISMLSSLKLFLSLWTTTYPNLRSLGAV